MCCSQSDQDTLEHDAQQYQNSAKHQATLGAGMQQPGAKLQLTCRYRSKWLVVLEFNRAIKTCRKETCSSFSSASRHSAGCCSVQLMQVYATLSGKLESISYISSADKKKKLTA